MHVHTKQEAADVAVGQSHLMHVSIWHYACVSECAWACEHMSVGVGVGLCVTGSCSIESKSCQ